MKKILMVIAAVAVLQTVAYAQNVDFSGDTVTVTLDNFLHVQLHEPLTAIASGQAAAFYKDGLLLGGGIIVE